MNPKAQQRLIDSFAAKYVAEFGRTADPNPSDRILELCFLHCVKPIDSDLYPQVREAIPQFLLPEGVR